MFRLDNSIIIFIYFFTFGCQFYDVYTRHYLFISDKLKQNDPFLNVDEC